MNLALSLAALALGPVLYGALQKIDIVRSALDGLLYVTIAGIVLIYIAPAVFDVAGYTALVFMAAGVGFAVLVEHWHTGGSSDRYSWVVLLGAIGLGIHSMMDGIALIPGEPLHGPEAESLDGHASETGLAGLLSNHLAVGVILHRIPVGMAIWWTIRPQLGKTVAVGALAIIAVATSAAYLLGEPVIALMEAKSVACFQAFVAGTLLHVIVFTSIQRHKTHSGASHAQTVVGERLGIITGLLLLFLVPHAH